MKLGTGESGDEKVEDIEAGDSGLLLAMTKRFKSVSGSKSEDCDSGDTDRSEK